MSHISRDAVETAEAMFAGGKKALEVAKKLRIPAEDVMALKQAWIAKNAPPKAEKPKAEKPAPKAKKAKPEA
jgi:hypothetical protein